MLQRCGTNSIDSETENANGAEPSGFGKASLRLEVSRPLHYFFPLKAQPQLHTETPSKHILCRFLDKLQVRYQFIKRTKEAQIEKNNYGFTFKKTTPGISSVRLWIKHLHLLLTCPKGS